eukprot:jgi/Psemu1/29054/gm1.29054_g
MSEDKDNKGESEGTRSRKSSYNRKGKKKKQSNSRFESSRNTFKGPITELKDHVFTYTGTIQAKQWLKSREAFISHARGKYGKDVRATLTKMEVTIITAKEPAGHDRETIKDLTPLEAKNWEFDTKEDWIAAKDLEDNLGILFDKLWGQYDLVMQNKVKSHAGWKNAVKKSDVITLLEIINEICSSGDQSKYTPVQIFLSNKKLHNFQQADNQSLTEYHEEFDMLVRMAEQHRNSYSMSDIEEMTIRSLKDPSIKGKSMKVYLATIFIMNANDAKYGAYKQSLYNNFCQGDDQYPKNVADAFTMLDSYKFNLKLYSVRTPVVGHTYLSRGKKEKNEESESSESDSSQQDDNEHIDGTAITMKNKTHKGAQQTGAMMLIDRSDSENSEDDNTESDIEDYLNEDDYNYQIGWTNCMTGITKKSFLTNIYEATEELHLYTNAGMTIITHMEDLPGFGRVWFHPEGIASVLSFDGVMRTQGYMIEYNNLTMGNYFKVTDPSGETNDILPVLQAIINFYGKQNFRITTILADGQFKPLTMSLAGKYIELNIVSCNEHVPEAKRYNRTIKERCQCIFSTLPYNKIPKRMIIEMVKNVTFYLNAFPWDNGISMDLAPTTIVTGIAPDYSLHFQVAYGTYAQTWDETDNTMKARTTGAIAMGPTQNFQGGLNFYSLLSGRIISRTPNDYTVCPMPDEAIHRIEWLARSSRPGLHFTNINNGPYGSDEDDDSTYSPSSDDKYDSDSSCDDDNDPSLDHPLAPAGVTNAIANANNNEITNNEDDEALDTDITGVAHERNEDTPPETELTGVATVTPVGITGVTNGPGQPPDTDNETTGKEDNKSSTATEQH